jgi:hypothetical protein
VMTDAPAPADLPQPLTERTRVLLPGIYAWLLTVALPVFAHGVHTMARLAAVLGLLALLATTLLDARHEALARVLGIYVFLGLAALTWALLGADFSPVHLDRLRTALGSLGWVLYAFGWGRLRAPDRPVKAASIAPGAPLVPRARLDRRAMPLVGAAVVAALTFEALAFRVDRPEHAVLAHATATACALLVLGAGTRVALAQGLRTELPSGSTRLNAITVRGAVLAVLFGVGLLWAALK